jgi:hypothetical protein
MFKTNLSRHYSDWAGPPQSPLFCTAPGNFHIAAQRRCFACHRRLLHRCRRPQQPQGPVRTQESAPVIKALPNSLFFNYSSSPLCRELSRHGSCKQRRRSLRPTSAPLLRHRRRRTPPPGSAGVAIRHRPSSPELPSPAAELNAPSPVAPQSADATGSHRRTSAPRDAIPPELPPRRHVLSGSRRPEHHESCAGPVLHQ